jgi:Fic family protein
MGRLWQTLILSRWNPLFAYLPVETVIRERQAEYYKVLGACDKVGSSTAFIEFLLATLLTALREISGTDQVGDQVTDQVAAILRALKGKTLSALECMNRLKLSHRPTFRANYLNPALDHGLIERTIPDKPNSRFQQYRLTAKGRACARGR